MNVNYNVGVFEQKYSDLPILIFILKLRIP